MEWEKGNLYVERLRTLNKTMPSVYATFKKGIEHEDPEISANVMIGLFKLATYLLDRQIKSLEVDFLKNGGLRERMKKARLEARNAQGQ